MDFSCCRRYDADGCGALANAQWGVRLAKQEIVRIDDVGSAGKRWMQGVRPRLRYGPSGWFNLAWPRWMNVGWLRRMPGLRICAVYEELTPHEWDGILACLEAEGVYPVVAVTACWVDRRGGLTPFPEQFSAEASWLKARRDEGRLEIANHGLTHCVVGEHVPRWTGSNEAAWREFYPHLPADLHREHLHRAQEILEDFFACAITTFVPPGDIWAWATYEALRETSIRTVRSRLYMSDCDAPMEGIEFIPDYESFLAIHDMGLKRKGVSWLRQAIRMARG